jgi:hypothetical protein
MKIGIHQPMYLPWLGIFDRIFKCDLFILLDNVPYSKNYYLNRNKIKTAKGWTWLTIPVLTKGNINKIIKEIEIDNKSSWRKKHWMSIYYAYSTAPYFKDHSPFFEEFYQREWIYLAEISTSMIVYLLEALQITTPIIPASSMEISGKKDELLLNICKELGADEYLSGPDGRNYLNLELWNKNGIKVQFHDYNHPQYNQLYGKFQMFMSVIDLIFNNGPESLNILKN